MRQLLFLVALVFLSCKAAAQKIFIREDDKFIYKLSVDSTSNDCVVKSIKIINKEDKREMEVIPPMENYIRSDDDVKDQQCFAIEDMNFDGYNDFRLLAGGLGGGHNLSYFYWLYDPKLKKFVRDSTFDELTEPEFNAGNKTITSHSWHGADGSEASDYVLYKGQLRLVAEYSSVYDNYTGDYMDGETDYIYIKGKRIISGSKDESVDEKRKQVVTTTKKRVNGKLKVVQISRTPAEKNKY